MFFARYVPHGVIKNVMHWLPRTGVFEIIRWRTLAPTAKVRRHCQTAFEVDSLKTDDGRAKRSLTNVVILSNEECMQETDVCELR